MTALESSGSWDGGGEGQQNSNALMKALKQKEEDVGFIQNKV